MTEPKELKSLARKNAVYFEGGFKVEVRELVIEKDLMGSLGVEAFSGTSIEI